MWEPIPISFSLVIQIGLMIMGLWAFYKVIKEIVQKINERHDKEQKWDEYAKNLQDERDKIYEKYDGKLSEIEKQMEVNEQLAQKERDKIQEAYNERLIEIENKIEYNHCEMDAKTQELKADVLMLTKSTAAILDGLTQLKCNGAVTEAKKNLDAFLMSKI